MEKLKYSNLKNRGTELAGPIGNFDAGVFGWIQWLFDKIGMATNVFCWSLQRSQIIILYSNSFETINLFMLKHA